MVDLHPIKTEVFDTDAVINVDPKGFTRQVDTFRETDFGLYMARGADNPRFGYLESWLLPALNLRANIFHFRPEVGQIQQFYFDVAAISHQGSRWTTRDLYIDLITYVDKPTEVVDIDELSAACAEGYISAHDTEEAIGSTLRAVEGFTRFNDDPMAWLASLGMNLSWAPSVVLTAAAKDPCGGQAQRR